MSSTRDQLLDEAEILFAEKGFYGTSINQVSQHVGLTKQGLLHYFPTKGKLYGAVLERAADFLMVQVRDTEQSTLDPLAKLIRLIESFSIDSDRIVRVIRLLVRELLDNQDRAATAQQWYLGGFLEYMEGIVVEGQQQGIFKDVHPMAFIYQILGAQQYFMISLPTLRQLQSQEKYQSHVDNHINEMRRLMQSLLLV